MRGPALNVETTLCVDPAKSAYKKYADHAWLLGHAAAARRDH